MPLGVDQKKTSSSASTDSLLDVITAIVGIILVFVLFTVISAQGEMRSLNQDMRIYAPLLKNGAQDLNREIVVCAKGQARLLQIDKIAQTVVDEIETSKHPLETISDFEGKSLEDGYFVYNLKTYADMTSIVQMRDQTPAIVAQISFRSRGENVDNFGNSDSQLSSDIKRLSENGSWIHFLIDGGCVDAYHRMSAFARQHGGTVGWEPLNFGFPISECLFGCASSGTGGFNYIRGHQWR